LELQLNNKLGRIYSLKSKITIDSLFEEGSKISSFPFTVFWKPVKMEEAVPFKFVISAPKRTFRFAYQRNRMKRITKEAVRLNKTMLERKLVEKEMQLAFFLIYSSKEEFSSDVLQKKIVKLFDKMIQQLDEKKNAH